MMRLLVVSFLVVCLISIGSAESTYQILDVQVPYDQAYKICDEVANSRLVVINSPSERYALRSLASDSGITDFWTGAVGLPDDVLIYLDGTMPSEFDRSTILRKGDDISLCGMSNDRAEQTLVPCNEIHSVICESDPTDCSVN